MEWRAARALGYRLGGGTARCWALRLGVTLTPLHRYLLDQTLLDSDTMELPRPALARQLRGAETHPSPWRARLRRFAEATKHGGCRALRAKHPLHAELEQQVRWLYAADGQALGYSG